MFGRIRCCIRFYITSRLDPAEPRDGGVFVRPSERKTESGNGNRERLPPSVRDSGFAGVSAMAATEFRFHSHARPAR